MAYRRQMKRLLIVLTAFALVIAATAMENTKIACAEESAYRLRNGQDVGFFNKNGSKITFITPDYFGENIRFAASADSSECISIIALYYNEILIGIDISQPEINPAAVIRIPDDPSDPNLLCVKGFTVYDLNSINPICPAEYMNFRDARPDSIIFSFPATFYIDGSTTIAVIDLYSYTNVADQSGDYYSDSSNIIWALLDEISGVTISRDGVLTVASDSLDYSIVDLTVIASYSDSKGTAIRSIAVTLVIV